MIHVSHTFLPLEGRGVETHFTDSQNSPNEFCAKFLDANFKVELQIYSELAKFILNLL